MSKFANALGQWELKIDNVETILKPQMNDVKIFRNILLQNTKDKSRLFDKFSDWMYGLIKKEYSEEKDEDIRVWVELHINTLLEESMIAFKWQTRDELAKMKLQSTQELKKMMSND